MIGVEGGVRASNVRVGNVLPEQGFSFGPRAARGGVKVEWGSKHLGYGRVFVGTWDVLQDVSNPVRLFDLEVRDQSSDLNECLAAGVGEAPVLACSRVWLAWGTSNDYVNAIWEPLEYRRAEAVGIEWESLVPVQVG